MGLVNSSILFLLGGKYMKLTKYQNPLSGKEGNLTDVGGLLQLVLGGFVLFGTMALAEKLTSAVSGKVNYNLQPSAPFSPVPQQVNAPSVVTY